MRTKIEPLIVSGLVLAMVAAIAAWQLHGHARQVAAARPATRAVSSGVHPAAAPVQVSGAAARTATRQPTAADVETLAAARQASLSGLQQQATTWSTAEQQRRESVRLQQAAAAQSAAQAATPLSLRLASFNVLGSNHTGRGGDASRYAGGTRRAHWASDVIRRSGLDFLGLSEVQRDQLAVLSHDLGDEYSFYPGGAAGNAGVPTNVMWKSSRFALVEGYTLPIRFVGQTRQVPYVHLRDLATNREFWVLNAHNAPEGRQSERNRDIAAEVGVLRKLIGTGLPVLFVGDLNEKARAFCAVTGRTPMHAANGGSAGGRCRPPGGMKIDWIFGDNAHVSFSGYTEDRNSVRRITDHALVMANAQLS